MLRDVRFVTDELSKRLVPDELWTLAEPLLPEFTPRPQGGGTAPTDERVVFTAVVFVLTSGCAFGEPVRRAVGGVRSARANGCQWIERRTL